MENVGVEVLWDFGFVELKDILVVAALLDLVLALVKVNGRRGMVVNVSLKFGDIVSLLAELET